MLDFYIIVEGLQQIQNIFFFAQFIMEQKVSDSINIALKKIQPVTASQIKSDLN